MTAPHGIDVLLCTFRRPGVVDTLASLACQDLPDDTALRVIVADNDDTPSARDTVVRAAADLGMQVVYAHAPARNISIARNACLDAATGEWVAFLDDDETADPGWIAGLLECATASGADAVFGPALAEYGATAPVWMRQQDHHSNIPVRRGGQVETGHTCNALLRWNATSWQGERFDLARGRSGGEDTEFFFRLRQKGARFEICEDAVVREPVAQSRLSIRWLMQRKYRMGQSYAASAQTPADRLRLGIAAAGKVLVCLGAALIQLPFDGRRNFWLLRAAMHLGVISGCLSLSQKQLYGTD